MTPPDRHLTPDQRSAYLIARDRLIEEGRVWADAWLALLLTKVPEHTVSGRVRNKQDRSRP